MAFGGVLAAVAVQPIATGDLGLTLGLWLLAGYLVVQCLLAVYSWLGDNLVVTSARILLAEENLLRSGIRLSLPLSALQDIRIVRPVPGRLFFGYGTLVSESAGLRIGFLPYPEQLYLEIVGLIFKDPDTSDD
jgi:hypothetical protein